MKSQQGCQEKSSKSQIPAIIVRQPSKQLLASVLPSKYSQLGADVASLSLSFKRANESIFILNSKILVTAQLYGLLADSDTFGMMSAPARQWEKCSFFVGRAGRCLVSIPAPHTALPSVCWCAHRSCRLGSSTVARFPKHFSA